MVGMTTGSIAARDEPVASCRVVTVFAAVLMSACGIGMASRIEPAPPPDVLAVRARRLRSGLGTGRQGRSLG